MELNKYIDYTNLKADAKESDIIALCEKGIKYNVQSICTHPYYVPLVKDLLKGTYINVCTVIGFPLGQNTIEVKEFETIDAISKGADEIDMVMNIGALKDQNYEYVKKEIETVRDACAGKTLKVIIETCLLTDDEIIKMTEICNETFVNFIKTSTGFSTAGANVKDVKLMNERKSEVLEIKASGGIRTKEDALNLVEAGATRLGISNIENTLEEN
jgi:deoxyribose-phosphate aldolase